MFALKVRVFWGSREGVVCGGKCPKERRIKELCCVIISFFLFKFGVGLSVLIM